ncbi:HpaII family restriction endonuclease [Caldifermentibacillus hisashii]|jgi:predicted protein tyrosine phosphatase|uniref:HpaII family restriction endonuclease n=1 Tax=Bacillaceae TaxID=186817 RepID=UPI002041D9F7|nr:HpaII family restriction endonuclease [Caldibacillus thermoamylovorans]MCM3800061.1 HpaII family restriction endonuclease [Caldibacillus thermoamylovorans]
MKGNKGEWSEIYTFLKLLGDGVLYAADRNLNRINEIYYPIISVVREEEHKKYYFENDIKIRILNNKKETLLEMESDKFTYMAKELFESLKRSKGRSLEFPSIESFLNIINVSKLKADSTDKRDITIIVHDLYTNLTPELGFSIKSKLGGNSTLLNPGESTNFIYEVVFDQSESNINELVNKINKINTKSKIKDRTNALTSNKNSLNFYKMESENFYLNLQMIDTVLPQIISIILLYYYKGLATDMKDLLAVLEKNNPLNYDQTKNHKFYEYKIKNFLTDVALGMTPQKKWNGFYDANGGYIIVKEDGEILCYHIYNRNEFQEYLINNTRLETPSSGRYHYGEIYEKDGKYYFKLNLQIRFK